ncbi:extracellular solute-binding protein [Vibrio vulnificus]|uniref:extracellular solute-binding protein n=1 Tax=Vibrio vulnificus TaxID=672 RepID=UPI0028793358|nr:extracellular solute-binding protein [Vibrio vulnificus]MDS1782611.1 extracellular solute-binding protein [Vibrio vulnificus]MDS1807353.1 extracellular solute-binding protein [Vibrio vulnificus]
MQYTKVSLATLAALSALSFQTFAQSLPSDLNWLTNKNEPLFASEEAKRGGTLTTYMVSFPQTLRSVGPDANSGLRHYFMDGAPKLAQRHPNTGKWIPQLADSWAFDADNKTVYFKLDKNAKWSDGESVTADDYVFMMKYYQSKDIIDPWYNDFFTNSIKEVVKYDDYTIAIKTATAQSDDALMVLINMPSNGVQPRPEHFFKGTKDDNKDGMPDNFVRAFNFKAEPTTAAYCMDNVEKGKRVTFKHVGEDWWGYSNRYYQNRYNVDKVRINVIRDQDIALKHFEKGSLDFFDMILPEYWHSKADSEGFEKGYIQKFWGYNQAPQGAGGLWMNTAMPLLDDINVRKGIMLSTDYDGMITNIMRGDYSRKPHGLGFGHGQYDKPDNKAPEFDAEKAIAYFEKAGFDKIGADGIRVNEKGQRLSFAITYGYQSWTPRIAFLKEQAKLAGLEFTLNLVDGSSAFKYILEKKHQLAFLNMGSGEIPAYWEYLHSDNANKPQTNAHTNYSSPELDKLIEAYDAEFDQEKRFALSHQIQEYVAEANIIVPGYMVPYTRAVHWRWLKTPQTAMTKATENIFHPMDIGNFWIDKELKKETEKAMKSGKTFPKVAVVDDRYKM